jgi:hypothetical protein
MAITRAQQAKQMLQDGGMLVQPSTTGKRPGYRGDAASKAAEAREKETGQKSSRPGPGPGEKDRRDPGERDTPGFNPTTNRFEKPDGTPEVARTPKEVQASKDAAIQQGRFDKPSFLKNFFSDYTKGTRKFLYDAVRNNPRSELAYLSKLTPSQAKGLPTARLRELYETIQDTDFSGDLSFEDALGEDFEKLSFEDYDALTKFNPDRNVSLKETLPDGTVIDRPIMTDPQGEYGALSFPEYKGRIEGSFGTLLGGNVGNIEVFKNPDGTYGYREKTGGRDETMVTTDPCKGPNPPAYCFIGRDADDNVEAQRNLGGLAPRFAGSIFDFTGMADGGRIGAAEGGIMDLETAREAMFLGGIAKGLKKITKKATRAVKKIAKSPIGKAALLYGAGSLGASFLGQAKAGTGLGGLIKGKLLGVPGVDEFGGSMGLLRKLGLTKGGFGTFGGLTGKGMLGLGGLTLGGLSLFGDDEEEQDMNMGPELTMAQLRAIRNSPYRYTAPRFEGSQYKFADGGEAKEPVASKTMPLLDMGGKEMDLRAEGGFVPIGRMEKADDVPARLSKNEFVFTADAVRNAGEGDVDKGAEVMYNMMKNLESGGEVSEESQGLEGAREMFQTSKRLEEVL